MSAVSPVTYTIHNSQDYKFVDNTNEDENIKNLETYVKLLDSSFGPPFNNLDILNKTVTASSPPELFNYIDNIHIDYAKTICYFKIILKKIEKLKATSPGPGPYDDILKYLEDLEKNENLFKQFVSISFPFYGENFTIISLLYRYFSSRDFNDVLQNLIKNTQSAINNIKDFKDDQINKDLFKSDPKLQLPFLPIPPPPPPPPTVLANKAAESGLQFARELANAAAAEAVYAKKAAKKAALAAKASKAQELLDASEEAEAAEAEAIRKAKAADADAKRKAVLILTDIRVTPTHVQEAVTKADAAAKEAAVAEAAAKEAAAKAKEAKKAAKELELTLPTAGLAAKLKSPDPAKAAEAAKEAAAVAEAVAEAVAKAAKSQA